MRSRYRVNVISRCIAILVAGSVFSTTLLSAAPLRAADMADHAQSLRVVPDDAAFYAAWVKNREQVESMLASNAWKKLISIPMVQMGWMQMQTQWQYPTNNELVAFKEWFDSDEGQDVYNMLIEMVSDEVFIYGDESVATLLEVVVSMNSEVTRSSFEALREAGTPDALDEDELMQEKLVEVLENHRDDLAVPTMVKGFRIQDKARAVRMLDLAHTKLRELLENPEVPEWVAEQLERKQVDGHELMTLTVTGEQLPWDEFEQEMAETPELFEVIQDIAIDARVVISIGVVGDYVVFAISDSDDLYNNLGEGGLLVDSDEFEKLNEHADQNVIAIGYASEYFMQVVGSQEQSFGDMQTMASGLLSMANIDELRVEAIEEDLADLCDDLLDYLPEPGAVAAVSFTTDRGIETYSYNWGEMPPTIDGSKPLTLIDHLGSDSLGWFVARGKQSVEGYDKMVDYCQRAMGHFEAIAKEKSSPDDWQEYSAVRDQVLPLLKQLDQANREYLIPGFADGQSALVFDASLSDQAWCEFMPAAKEPLPMPTFAMVSGVSDADDVKAGAAVYFDVIQQAIDLAHKANPDEVPAFQIPSPNESASSAGTIYSYELPTEWGGSERIAPNAGLSDNVLVLSVLPELTENLMAGSRPELGAFEEEFEHPLASAGHFKFAKFIDTMHPWIDYGIQMAVENSGEDQGGMVMAIGMFKPQVEQLLDVLKALDSYTGVTFRDDDVWVTHGELRIIDLED